MITYTLPFIAAIIGWFTNFLAVKMLFHPRKPVNLGVFILQGIFPKRQKKLAEKLGKVVSEELISINDLKASFQNPQNLGAIHEIIGERLDDFLNNKIGETMPMLAMFLNADLKAKIKNTLLEEFEEMLPNVIDKIMNKVEQDIDVEKIVYDKVVAFSSDKLEAILFSIMKKEFKFIELVGAVLGFIIGLVQLMLVQVAA